MATKKGKAAKAATRGMKGPMRRAAQAKAFLDIPSELIDVEGQIRTQIDQEGEPFLALVESIRGKGVLEPLIVTPKGERYRLISGERRLLAGRKLGLATLPARVIESVEAKEELIALQLTENLQRAELDPVDTALAVLQFIQARHAGEDVDVDGAMNAMILMEREPERVPEVVVGTLTTIGKITGKSLSSLRRSCSLLKCPDEMKMAVRDGSLGVSLAYLFAQNLDHPKLMELFKQAVDGKFTYPELEKELKKRQTATGGARKHPFSQYRKSVESVRAGIEAEASAFKKSDLTALLTELRNLIDLVEGRLATAVDDGAAKTPAPLKPAGAGAKAPVTRPNAPAASRGK